MLSFKIYLIKFIFSGCVWKTCWHDLWQNVGEFGCRPRIELQQGDAAHRYGPTKQCQLQLLGYKCFSWWLGTTLKLWKMKCELCKVFRTYHYVVWRKTKKIQSATVLYLIQKFHNMSILCTIQIYDFLYKFSCDLVSNEYLVNYSGGWMLIMV